MDKVPEGFKNSQLVDTGIITKYARLYLKTLLQYKPPLHEAYQDGNFNIQFNFTGPGGLELYKIRGRPKRLIDRR